MAPPKLRGGARPPQSLIMGFIDQMRAEGYAVESVCRVLTQQGCQIAARTITDAAVQDKIFGLAWTIDDQGRKRMAPEGLYGRHRAAGDHHNAALRNLANKLIGRMWWCLQNNEQWDESAAWPSTPRAAESSAA